MQKFKKDVCIVGGGGHIGLPLALTLSDVGFDTVIYDINSETVERILSGHMPFSEEGGPEMLDRALKNGKFHADTNPEVIKDCENIVIIIGTPVDSYLNPDYSVITNAMEEIYQYFSADQLIILRSTVFPGTTDNVHKFLKNKGLNVDLAFCPERVAQGFSLREFRELPQIISAAENSSRTLERVKNLFKLYTPHFIEMTPKEAEFAKLITNTWRYIQFAITNEFYMLATRNDLDFYKIFDGIKYEYPRMQGMPSPGFTAGPCLFKDTMQLNAYSNNQFFLGHAAMLVNEGTPAFLVDCADNQLQAQGMKLEDKTVGILGMAFKGESDDSRDSLSYKLKKLLRVKAKNTLCTDPYVVDDRLLPLESVLKESDILFLASPHGIYKDIDIRSDQILVDIWNHVDKR